jgi:hypothetical protein
MTTSELDCPQIIKGLHHYQVRYVLTGSLAAAMYGVPVTPRDFDIAPELSSANLQRLAELLAAWNAQPLHIPNWAGSLSPEECALWRPDPPTEQHLDHLLLTPFGLFDVVPHISGDYATLIERAFCVQTYGVDVWVAHPNDLLATMQPDKVKKHTERLPFMLEAQASVAHGARPVPLEHLGYQA